MDFPIQDDNIALEPPEILTFTITVINPVPGIKIDPFSTTIVRIVDEDGELIELPKQKPGSRNHHYMLTPGIEMDIHNIIVSVGDCLAGEGKLRSIVLMPAPISILGWGGGGGGVEEHTGIYIVICIVDNC